MANKALSLVQDDLVIFRIKGHDNAYNFCCASDYNETKGTKIEILENTNKKMIDYGDK